MWPGLRRSTLSSNGKVLAQRRAEEQNERGEAYRAYDHDAETPVGSDSKFAFALHLAVEIGVTKPLRDYVASGMPVPLVSVMIKDWPVRDAPALVAELLGQAVPQQRRTVAPSGLQPKRSPPSRLSAMRRGWWRLH